MIANENPGAWSLFPVPWIELPPPGNAFTDTEGVLPVEQLLNVLDLHGLQGTWWFAKLPPTQAGVGQPRYLTITYYGAGEYELRNASSSERHPFILASRSETDAAL